MKQLIILFQLLIFIFGSLNAQQNVNPVPDKPLTRKDTIRLKAEELLKNSIPVMGYRFVIFGDFDGDQKTDTLVERYTDSTFLKEAPKYYDYTDTFFDYGDLVLLSQYLERQSFIEWQKYNLKLGGGQLGFHYIENCGDLNLDGKDEILLVRQWSDWSNLNHAYIYTLHKNQWKEIYAIPIWEWQFPLTPSASMIPGMFGNYDFGIIENDSLNVLVEKELQDFKFIKYYPDHSIEFESMNPIWDNKKEIKMLHKLVEESDFEIVYINDSSYVKDLLNSSILYKIEEITTEDNQKGIIFDYDDPAAMFTTRIYLDHRRSPFKK